jgi:DNA-binding NarL/FixJ family response regulator
VSEPVYNGSRGEIRIMLVDDHASFRQPMAFVLEREPDLTVIAQAGSLAGAREVLKDVDLAVDVALVDLDLPDGSGVDFIKDLRDARPRAMALILSAHSDIRKLAYAIEAGAAGIMHKSDSPGEVVEALHRLYAREQILSDQEVMEAIQLLSRERREDRETQFTIAKLTSREREVLQALSEGLSNKEIAESIYVGVGTVHTHMKSLLSKLEVQSRLQALVFAIQHGLVKIG